MCKKGKVGIGMKKILNKNELTVLVVAIMLVTAGYLDYIGKTNSETVNTNAEEIGELSEGLDVTGEEIAKTGDATLVNSESVENTVEASVENTQENNESTIQVNSEEVADDSYFATSKLERSNMYSLTLENYQKILENSNISQEQKAITTQEISKVTQTQNSIMICENLLLAKGFDKCVIFVNDKSVSVIIGKTILTGDEIAQIQNIISRELNAQVEDIHISTK